MSPWNHLPELIFITQNPNKVQDAEKIITSFSINHVNFEVPEIQSLDPKEVIEHKLLFAYEKIQKPCFVMDASLFFDCLNWFPWPLIKFWFEKSVGAEKTCKICSLLDNNACKRTSTLWYYDWINKTFLEETIAWTIDPEPKWSNWYHRDTIFYTARIYTNSGRNEFWRKTTICCHKEASLTTRNNSHTKKWIWIIFIFLFLFCSYNHGYINSFNYKWTTYLSNAWDNDAVQNEIKYS